jgi:Fe-S oxidoreductase
VVEVVEPARQRAVWEVRKACLNIAMSMKGDAKPVSFIEDCAVPLEHLADYTDRLTAIFHRHGTTGTWYAHASVGTLHVRPILNLKQELGVGALRAIAEEAFEVVRTYRGSHSGEHGDGIVRSEFNEVMFGARLARAFEEVKDSFDPAGLLNLGKVVRPHRMDDRSLMRFPPGYAALPLQPALDWRAWGGFLGAAEMCNNNGACRKADPGVMCPSYRVTRDEQHLTRGRANTLRLALTGQLGPDALTSDAMRETLDLCVSCKGCRRECPTGVDMARMKIEVLYHYHQRHRLPAKERLIATLPRWAPYAARLAGAMNLRDRVPGLARLSERMLGFSARRTLPRWRSDPFRAAEVAASGNGAAPVVLFADTFNTWFEPENLRAAVRVLQAGGFAVQVAQPEGGGRRLCCGRTFLAAGQVEEARAEMRRTVLALAPLAEAGMPIVGLEPSCLLTFRDELAAVLPGPEAALLAGRARLFEEFLAEAADGGGLELPLASAGPRRALLHGHCHQKAFGAMAAVERALSLVPELAVEPIEASCCGMAGAFGYDARHHEVSMRMAELALLPAVRRAPPEALIVAPGTSCRHQIKDGSGREALHPARVLAQALPR